MLKKLIIKEGDDLRSIARIHLKNPNKWVQIALENNLDYPYIAQPGQDFPTLKVLYPGDTLMLTFSQSDSEKVFYTEHIPAPVNYLDLLLGLDIGLQDGQLVLVGGSEGPDFFTVKGAANLKQAIIHKFKVKKGSLNYYPDYGTLVHTYIGKVSSLSNVELVKAEFSRTVLEDTRVESTVNLVADFDGYDTISINSGLQLIGNFTSSIEIRVSPNTVQLV